MDRNLNQQGTNSSRADKMTAMWDHLASQVKAKREATSTSNAQFDTSRIVYKATEDLRDSPKETDALKSLPPSTRRMVTRARERHGVPSSPTPPPNVAYTRWSLQAENKGWDDNWKMPLQYKRTTVDKDDIPKLDEGEFLNDNLISFCLSYVQDKYKTSLGDRVFFHNSFFYEKLKMPGKSNINYEGVRSWTSKVDILSKDYIIVPVNEHHHWWVAIICHPGRLEPDAPQSLAEDKDQHSSNLLSEAASLKTLDASSSAQTIDVEMVDARPHRSSSSPEGATTAGMSSLSIDSPADADKAQTSEPLKTRDKRTVIDLSRESLAPQENLGASASVKRRSTGRRYDPDVPRIITLDSLGSAHSAACTHLKKYLVAEFKDKRKVEITDVPTTFGMTATNIPQQDNFCDCGVYLIGYIMEFAKNPDAFINDILEKKPAEWPLNAPDLRATIRSKILQLQKAYQENQIAEKRKRAAEKRARISKENKPHTPNTGEFPNSPGEMTCDTPAPSSGVPSAAPSRLTSRAGSPIKSPSDLAIPDGRRAQAVTRPDSPDVAEMGSHSHRDEVSSAIQLDHRRPTKRSYDALVGERMSGESSETFQTRDIAGGAREKEQDRQPPSPATLTKAPQSQDLAMVPSAPSPSEEISKQLPGPTSASRKQSSASASSGAEIEEQLKVEVLQAAEKVNGNRRLLSSARETFQDPVFLEKLPDSSPMSLPQVSPTRTPRRSPRQTKEVIVDILSVSSKEASRRGFRRLGDGEDDPVVLDDAGEPKPPATPRRGSKRNSKSKQEDDNDELVELPATPELELSMKRTSTQRTGGNDATWSSGSRNFPPAGLSKVSQPSTATRNPYKSPIGRPSKKTTAVLAPRHSSPKAPIDLTEDD
ncbi:cysteine proteinase [Thozetella sp. PMI_491]|nr:cysteine proteinase [Thozetella sp. PMI_491]